MNLKPINQTNLYGLKKTMMELVNLYNNKKLPNKILLSGDKGCGKCTLAFHLVNFILSKNEQFSYDLRNFEINRENKSFKLTINSTNPNLTLIDTYDQKKNIDINQIRDLVLDLNKSSFNNKERFVIIDNVETLNLNSANALLKNLEEPPNNTFFILINNNRSILPTLKSRCINFRIFLSHQESIDITNKLLSDDIFKYINKDLLNYFYTPGFFYNVISFFTANNYDLKNYTVKNLLDLIIKENLYKKNDFIKNIAFEYFELYCRKNIFSLRQKTLDHFSYFLNRINDTKRFNLDEDSLFMEIEYKVLNG